MTADAIPLRRDRAPVPTEPETVAQRIQALQSDLKAANCQQALEMTLAASLAFEKAQEIAANPSQPSGIREFARTFAISLGSQVQVLNSLMERHA